MKTSVLIRVFIFLFLLMINSFMSVYADMQNQHDIELSISSAIIHNGELVITYELINKGNKPVFIVDTDERGYEEERAKYFFIEYDSILHMLRASSYIAKMPEHSFIIAAMLHPVSKTFPGRYVHVLRLKLPVQEKQPYPEKLGMPIDSNKIKRVEIKLGVLACDSLPSGQISDSKLDFVSATYQISCSGKEAPLAPITQFQFFLSAVGEVHPAGRK